MALKSNRLRKELKSETSVTSSIYNAGFNSSSRVYEKVDTILAMTPTQYKNSGKGVCAVDLGDKEDELSSRRAEKRRHIWLSLGKRKKRKTPDDGI